MSFWSELWKTIRYIIAVVLIICAIFLLLLLIPAFGAYIMGAALTGWQIWLVIFVAIMCFSLAAWVSPEAWADFKAAALKVARWLGEMAGTGARAAADAMGLSGILLVAVGYMALKGSGSSQAVSPAPALPGGRKEVYV